MIQLNIQKAYLVDYQYISRNNSTSKTFLYNKVREL